MPKETFWNLTPEKRGEFIRAALEEFADNNYETASINRIVKKINIARGSVYQYFDDKLDLWLFLKEYAELQKLNYIQSVDRKDFDSFWDYYRALYMNGINFDLEQPLCSCLLYRIGFKENSTALAHYMKDWRNKAQEIFTLWISREQAEGHINPSIQTDTAVHFIFTMSQSIADLLQNKYAIDFDDNIKNNRPVFAHDTTAYQAAVSDLIDLLKKALS